MKYVISTAYDEVTQEKFYYCHMEGYNYVPVFGSIGNYQKARKVCDLYNRKDTRHGTN